MAKVNGQKIFYKVQGELRKPKDEEHKRNGLSSSSSAVKLAHI